MVRRDRALIEMIDFPMPQKTCRGTGPTSAPGEGVRIMVSARDRIGVWWNLATESMRATHQDDNTISLDGADDFIDAAPGAP